MICTIIVLFVGIYNDKVEAKKQCELKRQISTNTNTNGVVIYARIEKSCK